MRSFLTSLALTLMLGVSLPAVSADRPAVLVKADRSYGEEMVQFEISRFRQVHQVVIYKVADVKSTAATEEAFAIEMGYLLSKLTAVNGVENCAEFFRAKDGSGFASRVITIGAHAACPKLGLPFGEGYEATGGDIHSHIQQDRYLPSEVDKLILNGSYGPREKVSTTPSEFSPGDYESPGYMTNKGDIKFQAGEHRVRRVAWMKNASIGTLVIEKSYSTDIDGLAPVAPVAPVAASTAFAATPAAVPSAP